MKRDWELVRKILTALESKSSTQDILNPKEVEGYNEETVSYHIQLLIEAGLIEGTCSKVLNAPLHCVAYRLTWGGHEFIDEIRTDTVWNKVKRILTDKGIELSFESIKIAVKAVISDVF